jgi:CHRD domain
VHLDGDEEVEDGDPDGSAAGPVMINSVKRRGCAEIDWLNVAEPLTGGHVHRGVSGVNGPVVIDLGMTGDTGGAYDACTTDPDWFGVGLDPTRYYVNLHNDVYPDGAIRGTLFDSII